MAIETLEENYLIWQHSLPSIPDPVGFAGSFAGVSNGTLLVAGGANFPDGGTPWTGSKKVWHQHIFALEKPGGEWKTAGILPHALGYGATVSWKDACILIGGSSEQGHHAEVWMLKYIDGRIACTALPSLPKPIANTSGVLIGDVIYVAGGTETPDALQTEKNCWALDLAAEHKTWKVIPPWPGPSRMLAVTGTLNGNFYLFSGAELENGGRNYLRDAYEYSPEHGWKKLADLPNATVAAPSPAFGLMIFGGDDGAATAQREQHPGFSRQILNYHTHTDTWSVRGELPAAPPVTTTLTVWNGNVVIPGGEVKPAIRTTKVLTGIVKQH